MCSTVGETVKQNRDCDFIGSYFMPHVQKNNSAKAVAMRSLKARLTSRFHSPMRPCM